VQRSTDLGDALEHFLFHELKTYIDARRPIFFFKRVEKHPWKAMAARQRTPRDARRGGLLIGVPLACFSTYFEKVATL
jgi:hypothetical protein